MSRRSDSGSEPRDGAGDEGSGGVGDGSRSGLRAGVGLGPAPPLVQAFPVNPSGRSAGVAEGNGPLGGRHGRVAALVDASSDPVTSPRGCRGGASPDRLRTWSRRGLLVRASGSMLVRKSDGQANAGGLRLESEALSTLVAGARSLPVRTYGCRLGEPASGHSRTARTVPIGSRDPPRRDSIPSIAGKRRSGLRDKDYASCPPTEPRLTGSSGSGALDCHGRAPSRRADLLFGPRPRG